MSRFAAGVLVGLAISLALRPRREPRCEMDSNQGTHCVLALGHSHDYGFHTNGKGAWW